MAVSRNAGGRVVPGGRRRGAPSVWKRAALAVLAAVLPVAFLELVLFALGVSTVLEREDPFRGFSGLVAVFERNAAAGVYTSDRPANRDTFNPQTFRAEKPASGFRVFAIGGSSAYGFPWGAEAAFPAILEELLGASHPELAIEVVNASGISYASHRLRILVRELLRYDPDLLLVYSGHNEFIEKRFYRSLRLRAETLGRLQHLLHRSRLYGAVHALLGIRARSAGRAPIWGEAEDGRLQLRVRRDFGDPVSPAERRELEGFFAENLRAIIRMASARGVRVVLCTTPSNLRDWKPERPPGWPLLPEGERRDWERHVEAATVALENGRHTVAAARLEAALTLAPEDGPTWFLLGRAYEGSERWQAARTAYLRACELDLDPSRATEGINRAIRQVAAEEHAILVDVEELFGRLSPHGLVGFNLIEDYVHPTRASHERIAFAVWQALRDAGLPAPPTGGDAADRFAEIVEARRSRGITSENMPTYLYNQGMVLANQDRWKEARAKLEESAGLAPAWADAHFSLGSVLLKVGEIERAEEHFRRAAEIDPGVADMAVAHYNLGVALAERGAFPEAVGHFERTLVLRPAHADAHNNLGVLLARQGRLEEAAAHLEAALRLQPQHTQARDNLQRLRAVLKRTRSDSDP